ncbi:MAG: S8 family serine peptidase [Bryobacteraceae bacterium]
MATKKGGRKGAKTRQAPKEEIVSFQTVKSESKESLTVSAGAPPEVQTVVYIHGIGNKPAASVLKCQWDKALFGVQLGDRSRMAYWVNPEYYPTPSDETCADSDSVVVDDDEISTRAVRALADRENLGEQAALESEIDALTRDKERRRQLRNIADKMIARASVDPGAVYAADVRAKILPLPAFLRRIITQKITRAFLRDVNDFLFIPARRRQMKQSLIDRLEPGGGPFIVVAHSQGSMIAYDVLRELTKQQCDVRLFVTIGSPLGLTEVKDQLRKWMGNGKLHTPTCVSRWVNVSDRLDPVAVDQDLHDDYEAAGGVAVEDFRVWNPDSPRHPHSGTGYLSSSPVQEAVRRTAGNAFSQATGRAIIIKDLANDLEDGPKTQRHEVLIQLVKAESPGQGSLDEIRERLTTAIRQLAAASGGDDTDVALDAMKRFIAARLTRGELETLRTQFRDLRIERLWRNASKRALICDSTNTVQARPANAGYSAVGNDIGWAVLDTGIRGNHPHFEQFANVQTQWDCTRAGAAAACKPGSPEWEQLDKNGHGTHVAGIIAGCLKVQFERNGPVRLFAGMAPEAKLYGFKVLKDDGAGRDAYIIKALDHIAELNEKAGKLVIHGVNLSLGGRFDPSAYNCGHTPLCQELRRLWQQGVLVCLAAGNEGYEVLQSATGGEVPANMDLTIGDPANLEEAIGIGSIHKTNPHTFGVSFFSSRGPTADGRRKPDLVAPGEQILSAHYDWNTTAKPDKWVVKDLYIEMSGTSMATPHVSGMLAAFLSLRREFIGYPDRVKQILLENCTDLKRDPHIQGRGMPNLIKMLLNS